MNEIQNNNKNDNCLNSISFNLLGAFIIIFESISLVMSILCIAMTSWNFLRQFIKILNIISIVIISLAIIINVVIFIKIKNVAFDIVQNFQKRMCLSFILILFYIILIVFNIYNSIYLSIRLHIADYPEYGGRKRDQNYIDEHPDEFGDVPLKEFIIVGFCPSIISVLNLMIFILCVLFRKKMILTYDKMRSEEGRRVHEIIPPRNKHKHINRNRNKRKFSNENINTNELIIKSNNNTDPNMRRNVQGTNEDNNLIKIKINNSDDGEEYVKKPTNKLILDNKLDTKENLVNENKGFKAQKPKINYISSMVGTKTSMNGEEKEEK